MKWYSTALVAALPLLPIACIAQRIEVLPIGHISVVDDRSPTTWAMSGMDIIRLTQSDSMGTPIMRSLQMDARTVEILSRTQAPPLRGSDVRVVIRDGHQFVVVRRYLLVEALPKDARAEGTSVSLLAQKWARAVGKVLPQVAPAPNRFGI
jgi:hypothetical protein